MESGAHCRGPVQVSCTLVRCSFLLEHTAKLVACNNNFTALYHTAPFFITTPSTHELHCTDSLYLPDHPPTAVLLRNMIKETDCAYRLQTVSLTNCPHMYRLHITRWATAVVSITIVWKTTALQIQNSITWYYSPPHDMFIAATHKQVAYYATIPSSLHDLWSLPRLTDQMPGTLQKQSYYTNRNSSAFQHCIAALCTCHYTVRNNNNYKSL